MFDWFRANSPNWSKELRRKFLAVAMVWFILCVVRRNSNDIFWSKVLIERLLERKLSILSLEIRRVAGGREEVDWAVGDFCLLWRAPRLVLEVRKG